MSEPTDRAAILLDEISELDEIRQRLDKSTPLDKATFTSYSHGGGRLYIDDGKIRDLIADFYDEANRDFYFNARSDIDFLLAEVNGLNLVIQSFRKLAESKVAPIVKSFDELLAETVRVNCQCCQGHSMPNRQPGENGYCGACLGECEVTTTQYALLTDAQRVEVLETEVIRLRATKPEAKEPQA